MGRKVIEKWLFLSAFSVPYYNTAFSQTNTGMKSHEETERERGRGEKRPCEMEFSPKRGDEENNSE